MFNTGTRVILAGAGPGDPELLTLKACRAIAEAEVILYDALINKGILEYACADCLLIDVGKRSGHHRCSQDEINRMILFYSQRFSKVLRLKGGDPFVFGRGAEEIDYLSRHGIKTMVIPGISSAVAGPAAAGIPVTRRGVSESFWVITGTTSSGNLSRDLELAARSSATVVILMGLNKLREILVVFQKFRSATESAAVVINATMPQQQVICGTINAIGDRHSEIRVAGPGIIIIGKVADARVAAQIIGEEQVKMKLAV